MAINPTPDVCRGAARCLAIILCMGIFWHSGVGEAIAAAAACLVLTWGENQR